MNHLDDNTLNEYLDQALGKPEREKVELHLQVCAKCHAKLEDLQALFAEIDTLTDAELERDLTPSILSQLPQKAPVFVWTRVLAAQMGLVIGVLFWLAMRVVPFIRIPQVAILRLPSVDLQILFARLLAFQFSIYDFRFSTFSYQLPTFTFQVPTFGFEVSPAQMIALSVTLVLLWAVGNFVLLRSRPERG